MVIKKSVVSLDDYEIEMSECSFYATNAKDEAREMFGIKYQHCLLAGRGDMLIRELK